MNYADRPTKPARNTTHRSIVLGVVISSILFFAHEQTVLLADSPISLPDVSVGNGVLTTADHSRTAITECIPRAGWPSVLSKIEWMESPVKVAFLGGSVTAKPDCWRPQVMNLFRKRYPSVAWEEVNAAVGGTGSMFAAFRTDVDVVAYRPDLVFIEFAANDYSSTHNALATAEGVIRKIRRALPKCDMVIVYITTEVMSKEYDFVESTTPAIIQIYERLADHYRIPSIHMGLEIIERDQRGGVLWKWGEWGINNIPDTEEARTEIGDKYVFGSDSIHPHSFTGCRTYCQAIQRAVVEFETLSSISPQELPAPLDTNNYELAQWWTPEHASMSPTVTKLTPNITDDKVPSEVVGMGGYLARKPGDKFALTFMGSTVGVYMFVGPFSGDLVMSIDGEPPRNKSIFGTFTYKPRTGFYILYQGLTRANHTLTLDIAPIVPDKQSILATKDREIGGEYMNRTDIVVFAFGSV